MAEYDRSSAETGYVHATVALSGEAKLVAAELERMRVGGLVDRVTLEVIVPRARLDPTPEVKRLHPLKDGDAEPARAELKTLAHRLSAEQTQFVLDLLKRFEAITE